LSRRVGLRHIPSIAGRVPKPPTDEEFIEGSEKFPLGSYFSEAWNFGPPSVFPLQHSEDWNYPDPPTYTLQHSEAWSS